MSKKKMWAIIKFDKKKLAILKEDISNKLGNNYEIYIPRIRFQIYKKNKLTNKNLNLLGDYLFFSCEKLDCNNFLNFLRFTRGIKYILNGFLDSQKEITSFVTKCKSAENLDGFLSKTFINLEINKKYKFSSGPFSQKIFQIINLQKNYIKILMGDINTTIKKKQFLFSTL